MGNQLEVSTPSDTEIVMTRWFDAPRDLVFEAHTSCEHMKHWWGPRKYEIVECEVDFRVGGGWRMVHRGPEGQIPAFYGEYLEIVRPERITWTFGWEGAPDAPGPETVTFEEHDGRTLLTARSVLPSKEARDALLGSGMTEGAAETWERLEEYATALAARAKA